jgi:hypothetical protein
VFLREYGHLAQLGTKHKSLNHYYKRYLAMEHPAVHIFDFINRKTKFANLCLDFLAEEAAPKIREIMNSDAVCPELRLDGNTLYIGKESVKVDDTAGIVEDVFVKYVRGPEPIKYQTEEYGKFITKMLAEKGAKTAHFITLANCCAIKPAGVSGICCTILDGYCNVFNLVTDLLIMNIDGHSALIQCMIAKQLLAGGVPVLLMCGSGGVPLADSWWQVDGFADSRCYLYSNFDLGPYLASMRAEKITV